MNRNKVMAGLLTMSVAAGTMAAPVNVLAAEDSNGEKEEVVYVMTDADGSVDNVNVVNIFGKGDVTDYGDYSSVKMLTSTEPLMQDGDKITFTSDQDKTYYQGTMKDAEIPWNIAVTYTLDGKDITPEKLAGKSGALDVHIRITQNDKCDNSDYYDNYALQTTMALDTTKCENIVADGATLANAGADKQISYTVLPGKGLDTHVTADVTDFEMDAVSINGIKLNLNMDIDTSELTDKVTEIMDATKQLNDGSTSLVDGAEQLQMGSGSVKDGASSLYSGTKSVNNGIQSLKQGITSMQSGLGDLEAKKQKVNELSAGAQQLQTGTTYQAYKAAMAQNGLNVDQLQGQNSDMITTMNAQIISMQATIEQIKQVPDYEQDAQYVATIQQLSAQIETDKAAIALLQGDLGAMGGTETYLGNVNAGAQELTAGVAEMQTTLDSLSGTLGSGYTQLVDGVDTLAAGSKQLLEGAGALKDGTSSLYDGVTELCDGAKEMNDGTEEFCDKTKDMDVKTQDEIDDMIASISGDETETTSFVSSKNENVESVQFVIKTAAIEKKEKTEDAEQTQAKTSVAEKFIQLFKSDK